MPFGGQGSDDSANVANETQVEHPIGLIQHEVADLVQLQFLRGHQVANAARRADNDIGAATHPLDLHESADAAQDGDDPQRLLVGVTAQAVLDLQCQFARRCQDQRACGEMGGTH